MVKHIVLWKIRNDDQKQANIDQMISMLTSLVGKIEGLVSMEMGYNFNTASEYDVVLYSSFKNAAALKYYQNHPEHLKCKDFIGSVTIGRTCADYFYEEGVKASRPFNEVPDAPEPSEPTVNESAPVSDLLKDVNPVKEERSSFFSRNRHDDEIVAPAPVPAPVPAPWHL